MTTLQSWIAYSDTGERPDLPRALYLASDSRITWGSADRRWEAGRKVFATNVEPHLFGFCGDVVLPALIVGQIVSAIDSGILFGAEASPDERHRAVLRALERGVASAVSTPTLDFTIHHVQREREWPETRFRAWSIFYDASHRLCSSREIEVPAAATSVVGAYGSGRQAAQAHYDRWKNSDAAGRSRAILASFCDSIASGDDPLSGGVPQLAALYASGPPVQVGMFIGGRRYINGLEVELGPELTNAEWRDCLGQVIDPQTGAAAHGARRFARPSKLMDS
jgi:hypothetical protein